MIAPIFLVAIEKLPRPTAAVRLVAAARNKSCNAPALAQHSLTRGKWSWLLVFLPLLADGCMTHKLWTESALDEWNEPAARPNLRLFRAECKDDVVVVYDEYSGRRDGTRTRAFFLRPNQKSLEQNSRPHFVSTNSVSCLAPISIFSPASTNMTEQYYVVVVASNSAFAIYSGGQINGSHSLPTYSDGTGWMKRDRKSTRLNSSH